jgi:ribosomal protein S18 acetylase RimI-like enzyme
MTAGKVPVLIRPMTPDDADDVREIEARAFGAGWARQHGAAAPRPTRTRLNVLARLEKDPDGCFVAAVGDRPVGYIFSRTWAGVGWFGSFGVLPESQGQGIGRALLAPSLDYLRRDPRRIVGLETGIDEPANLGLYLRQGFEARMPSLGMGADLGLEPHPLQGLARWSDGDLEARNRWAAELAEATDEILPGLDYYKEIESTARNALGETILFQSGGRALGLSVVHLASPYEAWGDETAIVVALTLHPGATDESSFRVLTSESMAFARAHGKSHLTLSLCSAHAWAVDRLLSWGFQIERAGAFMALKGQEVGLGTDRKVDLSRWAG